MKGSLSFVPRGRGVAEEVDAGTNSESLVLLFVGVLGEREETGS